MLILFAAGSTKTMLAMFVAPECVLGCARPVVNVNNDSLRQAIAPLHMPGPKNASMRSSMWSVTPLDPLVGGYAAEVFSVRPTLFVVAAGVAGATLLLFHPAVRSLRDVPELSE